MHLIVFELLSQIKRKGNHKGVFIFVINLINPPNIKLGLLFVWHVGLFSLRKGSVLI